jgi:hypothetical protein
LFSNASDAVAEYQEPDWPVVDYEIYCMGERLIDPSRERPLLIRGPRLKLRRYAVFLGPAEKQCTPMRESDTLRDRAAQLRAAAIRACEDGESLLARDNEAHDRAGSGPPNLVNKRDTHRQVDSSSRA